MDSEQEECWDKSGNGGRRELGEQEQGGCAGAGAEREWALGWDPPIIAEND